MLHLSFVQVLHVMASCKPPVLDKIKTSIKIGSKIVKSPLQIIHFPLDVKSETCLHFLKPNGVLGMNKNIVITIGINFQGIGKRGEHILFESQLSK